MVTLKKISGEDAVRISFQKLKFWHRYSREWMSFWLLLSDLISLILAFLISVFLRNIVMNTSVLLFNNFHISLLSLFLIVFFVRGLYPGVGKNRFDEIRLITESTSIVILVFLLITFFSQDFLNISRLLLVFFWFFSILFVLVNRWVLRNIARKFDIWGEPILLVGTGKDSIKFETHLKNPFHNPDMFIVLRIAGDVNPEKNVLRFIKENNIQTIFLVISDISDQTKNYFLNMKHLKIPNFFLVPSENWIGNYSVKSHDFMGLLTFEVDQNFQNTALRIQKRILEIALSVFCIILIFPIFMIIAILIKLDSPGSVFYKQDRVGRNGEVFHLLKFRTMIHNADEVLSSLLESNPLLKAEWEKNQKLNKDPRITKVGSFLRRWSLDELPQLINIIRGDMSLIGPRPCLPSQTKYYGNTFELYKLCRPGLTGLWQVLGRNNVTFHERVLLDEYYIRNWSIWLDIYILFRTVIVLIKQTGI